MNADVSWGPEPLVDLLPEQLRAHGFERPDTALCARRLGESVGPAAIAALFVDLGACNFLDGDVDGAVASWRRAVASGQAVPAGTAMFCLGLLYEDLALHDAALELLVGASETGVEPLVTRAVLAEARCLLALDRTEDALHRLEALVSDLEAHRSTSPLVTESLVALADAAEQNGRPDVAVVSWRKAAERGGRFETLARERLVRLLDSLGRRDEVLQLIENHTGGVDELTAVQRLRRAQLLDEHSQPAQALEVLASINGADLAPVDRFDMIDLLLGQGLVNDAIDELEALLGDAREDHELRARCKLGVIYMDHAMVAEAKEMFATVVKADHPYWSPRAAMSLGDVHHAAGDDDAAVRAWVLAASSPVAAAQDAASERLTNRVGRGSGDLATESDRLTEAAVAATPLKPTVDPPIEQATAEDQAHDESVPDAAADGEVAVAATDEAQLDDPAAEPGGFSQAVTSDAGADAEPPEPLATGVVAAESDDGPAGTVAAASGEPFVPAPAREAQLIPLHGTSDEASGVANQPTVVTLGSAPRRNPYADLVADDIEPYVPRTNPYAALIPDELDSIDESEISDSELDGFAGLEPIERRVDREPNWTSEPVSQPVWGDVLSHDASFADDDDLTTGRSRELVWERIDAETDAAASDPDASTPGGLPHVAVADVEPGQDPLSLTPVDGAEQVEAVPDEVERIDSIASSAWQTHADEGETAQVGSAAAQTDATFDLFDTGEPSPSSTPARALIDPFGPPDRPPERLSELFGSPTSDIPGAAPLGGATDARPEPSAASTSIAWGDEPEEPVAQATNWETILGDYQPTPSVVHRVPHKVSGFFSSQVGDDEADS